jgi:hypothetical protein
MMALNGWRMIPSDPGNYLAEKLLGWKGLFGRRPKVLWPDRPDAARQARVEPNMKHLSSR